MRAVYLLTTFLLCAACGGDDSGSQPDGSPAADAASVACDLEGFSTGTETAERDDELGVLFYTASNAQMQRLTADFYFSLGATDGPQTVSFTGEGLDTCSTCVSARTGCGSLSCETTFIALSGTLTVTAMGGVGETLQGSLSNAVFAEAEIDAGTLETTLVPDGQRWCLDASFDVPVTAP
jgi:hypothetical protein